MALTPGSRLGPYEILAAIGAGGMGEVYRAIDSNLKRSVAIKVLPALVAGDADRLARFQREAEVLAALNHPNIAAIYGLEKTSNLTALVMELVEGEDLSQRIARGAIPLDEALPIAKQIADALEAAHEQGIIHRDLKPANIKVRADGTVKVLDFGLAKAMEPAAGSSTSLSMSPTITSPAMMTGVGMILGTAAYMSPEQARGKTVDKRADIWAFGCVLFEMLTSRRAFAGEDITDTIVSVISKEPDWPALPPAASASVRALLRRCLEKDPKRRLRDIGEAWLQLEAPVVEVAPVKKSGRLWPALAAASLAIAAAVLALTHLRPASVPDVTRFEILGPPGTTLPVGTPAVSPDGRTIAFVAADNQQVRRIYIRMLDSVEASALPGTEGAIHPFFSPDGRSLAFAAIVGTSQKLTRIDLAGGAPRVLADANAPWHGTWNQNGTILFVNSVLTQISANGGPATPVGSGSHPYFLPDGQRFLSYVFAGNGEKRKPRIELHTLGAKEGTLVLDDADSAGFVAPTPGGPTYMLYMRGSSVMAHRFDESEGKLVGEPTAILDNVERVATPAVTPALGVSRSGTLAFQRTTSRGESHLTWHDRTGKVISVLPSQAAGREPALSPDGQFVAVARMDPSSNTEDIWVVDLKRGTSSRLTFDKRRDRFPIWSPDGKRVTFTRDGVGVMEKDANGVGNEALLRPGIGQADDWSPDGKYLIVRDGMGTVALVLGLANVTGDKKPIPVGAANARTGSFQFSPDGKYIAYQSNESGRIEVYVQPTPPGTGRWQVSVNGGRKPKWRRDGKELFFQGYSDDMMAVDVPSGASFSAGTPRTLFRAGQAVNGGYTVSADGQRFLIYSDENSEGDSPIIVVQNWWAALRK